MAKTSEYLYDEYIVKKYADLGYKVTNCNAVLKPDISQKRSKKGTVNESKLGYNLGRAKARVKEYALSNDWDWWCTFTVSGEKCDRYDLKEFFKSFAEFLHGYNKRTPEPFKVRYLLVPEMHKDGAWHLHGFIKGIRPEEIVKNDNGFFTWRQYNDRFGFMSMERIKSRKKASSYITKYINKDIEKSVKELGAHTYYASKGLKRAEVVYRGSGAFNDKWDWESEYCRTKWYDTKEELQKGFEGYENGFDGRI